MNKQEIITYMSNSNQILELKQINDILYVRWDNVPYFLRDYIFNKSNYKETDFISMDKECNCGKAYFYNADLFFYYLEDLNINNL